jgi:hypothetical protein
MQSIEISIALEILRQFPVTGMNPSGYGRWSPRGAAFGLPVLPMRHVIADHIL